MEKLQSWNATLWTYWDVLQGSSTAVDTKHAMETRLVDYKRNMDKVGRMLTDHSRTFFLTVCIAEFLSVQETERLIAELAEQGVRSGRRSTLLLGWRPRERTTKLGGLDFVSLLNVIDGEFNSGAGLLLFVHTPMNSASSWSLFVLHSLYSMVLIAQLQDSSKSYFPDEKFARDFVWR